MTRIIIIMALLSLTACAQQPNLAQQPKDQVKYEAINESCRKEASHRSMNANMKNNYFGGFGLIGAIANEVRGNAVLDKDNDFNKTESQIWGECLASHGYKLAE